MPSDSNSNSATGKVYLVGAGPGDPGLITVRGAECLAQADLVLYDGLVNPLLLRLTKGVCERTARARRDDVNIVSQSEINARLIREARAGRIVVRLKGGDPYIFGRGSEEAAALHAAAIPFEVVPGVTAATGAGEYAGFSFTHREISSAVAFVTGHEDPSRESSRLNYQALATFPGTLVFYMGLKRLSEICHQLHVAGMPKTMPAAVVCQVSLAGQRVVEGTLETLPALVATEKLKPPSLIVVGECVRQRTQLSWFEKLPLFGMSIGVTRPEEQAEDVAQQIVRLGGEPVLMPMIEVGPVNPHHQVEIARVLKQLCRFHWLVFTSVNGVSEFFRHLHQAKLDVRCLGAAKVAAIGPSTAEKLMDFGIMADVMPTEYRAESLAKALEKHVRGKTVLWVRASRGRDVLPKMLTDVGALFAQLVVYENRDVEVLHPDVERRLKQGTLDWIGLSSPSIARRFAQLLEHAGIAAGDLRTRIATISPVTSAAARASGLKVDVEATEFTWPGILQAIERGEK
ncbi:MAG TPA: uroporphyrinogen-III C-methyltransferase [Planctomycetaceae bacterium]|nr:uroporphyrinogen-III C-methyltransferase [Planctomycetaceae bacterium]